MTHYTIRFDGPDRKKNDLNAIAETERYLGAKGWAACMFEMGRVNGCGTAEAVIGINSALAIIGVQGYPVHALARKYYPHAYKLWMESGDDPVMLDAEFFPLEKDDETNGEETKA